MADRGDGAGDLHDPSAHTIRAGDLEATFLPGRGMLGASLRHRGTEILGRVDELAGAAEKGSAAGIPLLHPWANRLAGFGYRVAGRDVALEAKSALLHYDDNGLPIHGVPWSRLAWEVSEAAGDRIAARLDWADERLLSIFPFRHVLEMTARIRPDALTIETTLVAGPDAVPVSFGFHPYFTLPGAPRDSWRMTLPAMRRLALDAHQIPTGAETPFAAMDAPLAGRQFDDGFAVADETASFSVAGGGRRITVVFLEGYRYAQIFAPPGKDFVALEPMTAPTNALASGNGLTLVPPGGTYRAAFEVRVAAAG